LQSASGNAPSNPQGFLEGYVPVALALGPLRQSESLKKLASQAVMQALVTVAPKPSFMLNERAYAKLPGGVDEKWFLRSLSGLVQSFGSKMPAEPVRCVYIHLRHLTHFVNHRTDVPTQSCYRKRAPAPDHQRQGLCGQARIAYRPRPSRVYAATRRLQHCPRRCPRMAPNPGRAPISSSHHGS
jgi:hypothetical protein